MNKILVSSLAGLALLSAAVPAGAAVDSIQENDVTVDTAIVVDQPNDLAAVSLDYVISQQTNGLVGTWVGETYQWNWTEALANGLIDIDQGNLTELQCGGDLVVQDSNAYAGTVCGDIEIDQINGLEAGHVDEVWQTNIANGFSVFGDVDATQTNISDVCGAELVDQFNGANSITMFGDATADQLNVSTNNHTDEIVQYNDGFVVGVNYGLAQGNEATNGHGDSAIQTNDGVAIGWSTGVTLQNNTYEACETDVVDQLNSVSAHAGLLNVTGQGNATVVGHADVVVQANDADTSAFVNLTVQGNALEGGDVSHVDQSNTATTEGAFTGNYQGNLADVDDACEIDQENDLVSTTCSSDTEQTNVAVAGNVGSVTQGNSAVIGLP